jgi:hypothetical protein
MVVFVEVRELRCTMWWNRARRSRVRDRIERLPPPRSFGEPEDPPPLEVFPPAMARATAAVMAMLAAEATPTDLGELRGVGVGTKPYRGRACVIDDVTDALIPDGAPIDVDPEAGVIRLT